MHNPLPSLTPRLLCGLALLALTAAPLRAGNPLPLSHLIDKGADPQAFITLQGGSYVGGHEGENHLVVIPYGYYGTKQLFNWSLWNTPVEFDLGRTLQFSLRNIDGSAWSVGAGIAYNVTAIRERNPSSALVPGADRYAVGPYAFGRYQATEAVGLELSERASYNLFGDGESTYRPKSYIETETNLLIDVDLRQKDPETKLRDNGFYGGLYGFARQLPDDLYDNPVGEAFQAQFRNGTTYGLGTLVEYLWKTGKASNIGFVLEGEATADTNAIYLSQTDGYRSRGYLYPHLLVNQALWRGGSVSAHFGPSIIYQRFGDYDNNPTYLRASVTLTQAVSAHVSLSLIYQFDDDPYKPSFIQQDRTSPHYVGLSATYGF